MSERIRNLIDLPEKAAIGVGATGLLLSLFYPPALGLSLQLIMGGGISMGITNGVWPKKRRET